ncbi:unnamed protein product [Choristocarpus tenellus]
MWRIVLDWCHLGLVGLILCLSALAQGVILCFYILFPCPEKLDQLFRWSKKLQSSFRMHLGASCTDIEGRRTSRELAEDEGFAVEDHYATTEDGYVLVVHRIIDPSQDPSAARPAVLLMHGLMQDSEALLCGGRKYSLGLHLATAGFDVFCGNNRGNRYSHKHLRMSPAHSDQYWDFSIDELARYDVPAMVDRVLLVTG